MDEELKDIANRFYNLAWDLGNLGASSHGNRKSDFYRWVDSVATIYHKKYENLNYDFKTNGECNLLKALSEDHKIDYIIDVGANVGEYSIAAQEITGAHVYSFEPVPDTYSQLVYNIGKYNTEIESYNMALGDVNDKMNINVHNDHTMSSILDLRPTSTDPCEIQVCRGDDILKDKFDKDKLILLKVDTEGYESKVLTGFGDILECIDIIQFEYGKASIFSKYNLHDYYRDYNDRYMIGKIFPTHIEFNEGYFGDLDDLIGPNYIMVNRNRGDLIESIISR